MAHHGGPMRTPPPRAHRPRAPIMSAPAPLTAPLAPLQPPRPLSPPSSAALHPAHVSLAAPRPDSERHTNEYVETPLRPAVARAPPPPTFPHHQPHQNVHHHQHAATTTTATTTTSSHHHRPTRLHVPPPPPPVPHPLLPLPITKQPPATGAAASAAAASFSKDPRECSGGFSIICAECGRCRCAECQKPRPLPTWWMCHKRCFCSADAAIDYATCLCCVKGLFYHCSESDGGAASCADNPCGCGPERRAARWGCLAALSCALPCLWLYWPLQCCKGAVEVCYARRSRGCRCRPLAAATAGHAGSTASGLATPEKRLLDGSPDF